MADIAKDARAAYLAATINGATAMEWLMIADQLTYASRCLRSNRDHELRAQLEGDIRAADARAFTIGGLVPTIIAGNDVNEHPPELRCWCSSRDRATLNIAQGLVGVGHGMSRNDRAFYDLTYWSAPFAIVLRPAP